MRIVLASTSAFRRALLQRLGLAFETIAPDVDETPAENEPAEQLVMRLAEEKAEAVARYAQDALVIGSDQVAVLNGSILGKPGTHQRAVEQLTNASGKTVTFYTGLCVLEANSGRRQTEVAPFRVTFRNLDGGQIERYLNREQPYNCAGSFRSEGLGIALFAKLEGDDPNALIGLPLIRLVRMLENEGVSVL